MLLAAAEGGRPLSILGNRVLRKEDPKFLTTGGMYVDDLPLPGAVHATFVRSTMAHARITSIDTSEAATAPGVVAVLTTDDIDVAPIMGANPNMPRPWLAKDTVRFVGEAIAVVLTEEKYQGPDAAELVFVDYEPLPVVVDPEVALESNDVLLFPEAGNNIAMSLDFGRDESLFEGCEVVVRRRIVNQRVAPCPLEVRATAAQWGDDGRVTVWASTQGAHSFRTNVARHAAIDAEQIRVIAPDVGGGFGAKIGSNPEELIIPLLARRIGRPVKWVETRSESMVALGHGRGQIQTFEIGGSRDGKVEAYRLSVVQECGGYPDMGAFLPYMTRVMTPGVYDIPKAEFVSQSVVTNTTPVVAYRGAGRPEATAAIERAMDLFASEIGMDPIEVRRRNLIGKDAFPFTSAMGTVYDVGDYEGALDLVLEAAGYDDLRAEQQRRRDAGDPIQVGIGVSVYVEVTAGPSGDGEFGSVEIRPDGTAVVHTGVSPHGQGHHTSLSMIVSDRLGIPMENIEVIHGDTDLIKEGGGTMGSRSLQLGGSAIDKASHEVLDKAKQMAADMLEANPDDIVFDKIDGRFAVAGSPTIGRTWGELATEAGEPLAAETRFQASAPTFPFGAHLAVVDVDTETGKVTLRRLVAVDDAGRILNPLLAEGQIHGGLAQGIAQALFEEVRFDEDGNPVTSNLADYAFVTAAELPSFETVPMETPTPINPLGAKGIGESGSIGSTPAVQSAVVDALSPFGIDHLDIPATPEKVWQAIHNSQGQDAKGAR